MYSMKRGRMNKKGLDAIVTTVIIILLAIVAIAIIWSVVRGVVQSGADQVAASNKCISLDLKAVSVSPVAGGYTVTLRRGAGGEDISGIKVTLFNDTANSGVLEFGAAPAELETEAKDVTTTLVAANKLEFTPYFTDASGTEQLCSQTGTFNF